MILVDTSALLDFLTGRPSAAAEQLESLLRQDGVFYLAPLVVQEVLQGARDEAQWEKLEAFLASQLWIDLKHPVRSRIAAARIYFDCRRRGLTVRSSEDCVIAQVALEHDLALLHNDRDFEAIKKVRPLRTLS